MLKSLAFAAALALAAFSASAHGPGHDAIDPEQALIAAVTGAGYLTRNKVNRDWSPLDQSWVELKASAAKVLATVDGDFMIAVTNPQNGRVFYMLIGSDGGVLDANLTGVFPYVWDINADTQAAPVE